MNKTDITHATIVPLIGGEPLGASDALNKKLPEYVLSYSPFAGNDLHYINYLREKRGYKGEYILLDEEPDWKPKTFANVISTTCPCAGLSSLSRSSNADAPVNEWLYTTAEYTLKNLKPDVFWGENAPRLFSLSGKPVVEKLKAIGDKYGYSLNLYSTKSTKHGIAQIRPRTFYFFTKGLDEAPVFSWFDKENEGIECILQQEQIKGDPMNVRCNDKDPMEDAWLAYAVHCSGGKSVKDLYNVIEKTVSVMSIGDTNFFPDGNLHDAIKWMDENGFENGATRTRRMQAKLDKGMGYWAHGVSVPKGNSIGSFIGSKPTHLVNPFTEKYLTIRDGLRIMKMPDDFCLIGDDPRKIVNHVCQNVPQTTARDMMDNIIEYLEGKCEMLETNGAVLRQSNVNQQVSLGEKQVDITQTETLSSFM